MYTCINGKFYREKDAKISVLDRGFLYGDGIFETMRVYNGEIFALDEHLKRLKNSATIISLEINFTREKISSELYRTLKKNKTKNAILRLSFSRGNGWGLNFKDDLKPTMVILCRAFHALPKKFYQDGIDVVISKKVVSYSGSILSHVKSTNYIPNILAKNEATNVVAFEALLLNEKGYITEGTVSNFFVIKKGVLITAPLKAGILPGITRKFVLELAKKSGIKVEEKLFKPDFIYRADEAFLTNTSIEVLPVRKVNGKIVNSGKSGEITLKLKQKFQDYLR